MLVSNSSNKLLVVGAANIPTINKAHNKVKVKAIIEVAINKLLLPITTTTITLSILKALKYQDSRATAGAVEELGQGEVGQWEEEVIEVNTSIKEVVEVAMAINNTTNL